MQNAPKPWSEEAHAMAEQVRQMADSTPLAVRHMEFIKGLRRGDSVYVIPFKQKAMVDRIRHNRRTLVVFADGRQLEIGFDQITRPDLSQDH